MSTPETIRAQATAPAVLHLGATKAKHRTSTDGGLTLAPAGLTETYGVNPQVFPPATPAKISPKDCTAQQLFEIVMDVARKFRTAKDVVAEHTDYILRLKTEVFKVRFGSVGVRVVVTCMTDEGLPASKKMVWKEFCERQFGVSADWINRVCDGKAANPKKRTKGGSEPLKLDGRQQAALVKAQLAANEIVAASKHGGDWQTPFDEHQKVAVTPAKLNSYLNALSPEPDWKSTLTNLVDTLEQCGDTLPVPAKDALNLAQEVLGGKFKQKVTVPVQISGNIMRGNSLVVRADARHIPLPNDSVQCVISSPPYWGLRKYSGNQAVVWGGTAGCRHQWGESHTRTHGTCLRCGAWRGSFGLEPTVHMYIDHTVEILREVRRVLRPDGVCFWNVADSYSGSGKGIGGHHGKAAFTDADIEKTNWKESGLKPKNLCLIPQRVVLAAQADGWCVRSVIAWVKPNAMPESVTDRPTDAYEHILMLTRSAHYYWNAEAVKEAASWQRWGKQTTLSHDENQRVMPDKSKEELQKNTTRNLRNVWTFPTQPYKGAHFATFPEELPRRCILAASSPGDVVLDCFGGAGTTAKVAVGLGRHAVSIDLAYHDIARKRIAA